MRIAFLVLLLANVILFVWGQGRAQAPQQGREPERLNQQLAPEKLRSVPLAELTAAAASTAAGLAETATPAADR